MKKINFPRKCHTCGASRVKQYMGVDPFSLKVYCITPEYCGDTENHPNAEANIKKREGVLELIPLSEPSEIQERLEELYTPDIIEILSRNVNGTISFKPTPATVIHLLKLSQIHGYPSANSVASAVMEDHIASRDLDDTKLQFCSWELRKSRNFRKEEPKTIASSLTPPSLKKEATKKEAPTRKKEDDEEGDIDYL